jgi:hypothetical protein
VTAPDRDSVRNWARLVRQASTVVTLPGHIPYRLATAVPADEVKWLDATLPDNPGAAAGRIVALTDQLLIDCQCAAAGTEPATHPAATTSVTIRRLRDVASVTMSGNDLDWSPDPFGDAHPTPESVVVTFRDGATVPLGLNRRGDPAVFPALDLLRTGMLATDA